MRGLAGLDAAYGPNAVEITIERADRIEALFENHSGVKRVTGHNRQMFVHQEPSLVEDLGRYGDHRRKDCPRQIVNGTALLPAVQSAVTMQYFL